MLITSVASINSYSIMKPWLRLQQRREVVRQNDRIHMCVLLCLLANRISSSWPRRLTANFFIFIFLNASILHYQDKEGKKKEYVNVTAPLDLNISCWHLSQWRGKCFYKRWPHPETSRKSLWICPEIPIAAGAAAQTAAQSIPCQVTEPVTINEYGGC